MNIAIVLAGGVGSRMGLDIPKQFYKIKNREILSYTLEAFQNSNLIDKILVVSIEGYFEQIREIVAKYNITKFENVVKNGSTRQKSVFNALEYLSFLKNNDIVLIHDGVRAMISSNIINKCVEETKKYKSTTLAQKSVNTIAYSESDEIEKYIDRKTIYNIQTPQSFEYDIIYNAHKKYMDKIDITDDTQLVMDYGNKVHIIENNEPNFKLTTKEDIILFEYFLNK